MDAEVRQRGATVLDAAGVRDGADQRQLAEPRGHGWVKEEDEGADGPEPTRRRPPLM